MGLSKDSVKKARKILRSIDPDATNTKILEWTGKEDYRLNLILGVDRKIDGSWENVFLNVKNMTPKQRETWERRKKEVHNTNFLQEKPDGITCIGWI